jgi:hypothetical protein
MHSGSAEVGAKKVPRGSVRRSTSIMPGGQRAVETG